MSRTGTIIPETGEEFRQSESLPIATRLWAAGVIAILLTMCGSLGYLGAADGARGIPVGIFRVKPSLTISSQYDDNVFKSRQKVGEKILNIQPVVQFSTHWKKLAFQAGVSSSIVRYESRSTEDFEDHNVSMDVKYSANRHLDLGLKSEVSFNHESRGAPDVGQIGAQDKPRRWKHYGIDGSAQYTQNRFRTQLELSHQIDEKQEVGNYWNKAALTLMFAMAPRTSLATGLGWKGIVYDNPALRRDSQEKTVNVGVNWTGTAKTQGDLRVGYALKEPENSAAENSSAMTFGGSVSWKPLARTSLNLNANRAFAEGGLVADYYVTTMAGVGLSHKLRSFLTFKSNLDHTTNDYSSGLENEIWKGGVGLEYAFPRWLTMSSNFGRTSQKSNQPNSEYDSNEVMISLTGGL
ncbi:MAG: outer membrane beta-barrel protein [Magnetococcus sp. DMHC-1]|nr:outer membrane beta-barrel protein [Magnetococcales bacterium]